MLEIMERFDGIIIDWNNSPLTGGDDIVWNGKPVNGSWDIIDVLLSASRIVRRRVQWANVECQHFLGVAPDLQDPLYRLYASWHTGFIPRKTGMDNGVPTQDMYTRSIYDRVRTEEAISFDNGIFLVIPLSILNREIILAPLNGMHKVAPWSTAYIGRLGKDGPTPEKGT